jgi:pSer/pThr/pTyr-binding forkhead associated (FHA) protein
MTALQPEQPPPVLPHSLPAVKVTLACQDPLACPREIVIEQFPCDLGRASEVAVRIDDRWLSRRHCRLELRDGAVVVRDLGSRHGTFVNGCSVSECKLLPGDKLALGLSHFVASYEVPVDSPAAIGGLANSASNNAGQRAPALA